MSQLKKHRTKSVKFFMNYKTQEKLDLKELTTEIEFQNLAL
ncbi:4518_t:CDS:1, partial [Scutellospora calospora]